MGEGDSPSRKVLKGVLERILFCNEDTGYAVARLSVDGRFDPVTITGTLATLNRGQQIRCTGAWTTHPRFGQQFKVDSFEIIMPGTREGIIKYLSSGAIKGIGPSLAKRLVDRFGTETLEVIGQTPQRLQEVSGIGESRVAMIQKAWGRQRGIQDIMVFLRGHGLGPVHSAKVFRHYGKDAIRLVKENPYRLSDEIFGIGFKTADRIALNLGVPPDSPFRIRAALIFLLGAAADEGHLCLPERELIIRTCGFLEVDPVLVEEQVAALCTEDRLVKEEKEGPIAPEEAAPPSMIFIRGLRDAEEGVRFFLARLMDHAKWTVPINIPKAIEWSEREAGIALEAVQREAVEASLREPVLIITGGPGVGKTTIVRCIAKIFAIKKFKLSLAAPTGRAAKRLSEATGFKASTIHRLLRFSPKTFTFERDEDNPLPCDVLIVDESSMIDVPLMDKLARAIRPAARLILVGDVDQLPSVGPGVLLRSLIQCGRFPVVRLTRLFRQEEGSGITVAAHAVNAGRLPRFTPAGEEGETYFIESADPEEVAKQIVEMVRDRIPERFGLDPMTDVQVLAPMHKGAAGTENLNRLLQEALNPEGDEMTRFGRTLRVGDKVMQIRNNYNLNVFNGDIGFIRSINREKGAVTVRVDDRDVVYDSDDLDELVHAYCVTVHKSQGSEFPAVVVPLLTQHYIMLRRNLLYTGITRARRLLVVLGSKRALQIAVSNSQTSMRYSLLEQRLRR